MIKSKKNALSLFLMFFILSFCLENTYAQSDVKSDDNTSDPKQAKFIPMPDDVNQSLLKSIYERTFFNINRDKNGYYLQSDEVRGKEDLKRTWLGSPIRNIDSLSDKITIYFKPKFLRKVGDVILESFKIDFTSKNSLLIAKHSFAKEQEIVVGREGSKNWIVTKNKSDVIVHVPAQNVHNKRTLGFMVCPRAYERRIDKSNVLLIDTGYVIDKVKMNFTGETKASFTTGALHKGKIMLNVLTTDVLDAPEIARDISFGKDPRVEIAYIPSEEKIYDVVNDNDIIGGLKFLYDMQYESGRERVSDFTNYNWIKKNKIDLPFKIKRHIGKVNLLANISGGTCYNVVLNAKIFKNYYLDGNKQVEFIK